MKQILLMLLAGACVPLGALSLTEAKLTPEGVEFALSGTRRAPVPVTVMLRTGGKVFFAEAAVVPAGRRSHRHMFSPEFLRCASGRKAELLLTAASGDHTRELPAEFPGERKELPKPVNYGFFTDRDGKRHAWYMNHASEYVFDGETYYPVGGMLCPRMPGNTSSTPPQETQDGWKKRLAEDAEVLDRLLAYGIDDVYINLSSWAEVPRIQEFVNLLESRGVRYGWQLNARNGGTIPAWFITFDRANPPRNWQGAVKGEYRSGKISFQFPREYNVIGFLATDGNFCRFLPFKDNEGVDVRKGIDVDDGKDFSKQRQVVLTAALPLAEGTLLTLIPQVNAKMRHPDLWNPSVRAEIRGKFEWVGKVRWGSNFRFFVDPVVNEGNMLNATENLRQDTPEINRALQSLLQEKYRTLAALRDGWSCPELPDFETASRVIPFRTGNQLLLLDPGRGKAYPSELATSLMWPDYNEMIRKSYSALLDEVSAELKSIVDLPVVNKSVGVAAEELHISRRYLGSDGIGLEVYLNHGPAQEASGGGAVAAAAATPHTVWKVVTETGFSAKPGNGGVRFFPDEKTLADLAETLHDMNTNGLFFFGLKLPKAWQDHNVYDLPEKLQWMRNAKLALASRPAAPEPKTFVYPAGFTWWYWSDQSRALYDHPRGDISVSLPLPTGEWAYATHVLPESAELVLLHLPPPPYPRFYAPEVKQLLQSGKEVIFAGSRPDLGTIPELDRFFTAKTIAFADGSSAQELTPLPGSEILAAENGRAWALRHGKLVIVSRTPVASRTAGFHHLKKEWIP